MKICRNTPPDLGIPRAVLRSWQDVPAINVLPSGLTDHRGAWPSHVRAHAPMHVHMCDSVAHTALSDDVYFAFAFRKRGWFIDRAWKKRLCVPRVVIAKPSGNIRRRRVNRVPPLSFSCLCAPSHATLSLKV